MRIQASLKAAAEQAEKQATKQPFTSAETTAPAATPIEQAETSSSSTAVPTSSSSTAAPSNVGGEVMEQAESSSSTAAPAADETTEGNGWMVTKDMEAEVGDDNLLESKEVGTSKCGFSLYELSDGSTGWGGAFACSGEPMVDHFPVDVSVGFTEQECAVVTGLPQHSNAGQQVGHDQDLYMTVHANCRSSVSSVQKWRVCSWRPDPSSVLCRALGMPCCTYVSNMVAEDVEESCVDYVPGQCNIVLGFDGVTTKQYGMKMHDCEGEAPYNPMCAIQAGELKASAGTSHSSSKMRSKIVNLNVLAGVALIAIGAALRLKRRRQADEAAAAAGEQDGEDNHYLLETQKLESPLRAYGALLGYRPVVSKVLQRSPSTVKKSVGATSEQTHPEATTSPKIHPSATTCSNLVFEEYE